MHRVMSLTVAALFLAGSAFAGAPEQGKGKKPAKLTAVKVCPISGHEATAAGGTGVVGKYRVGFCCPKCKPAFAKLSKADKEKKIADALKRQQSKKTGSVGSPQLIKVMVCPMMGSPVQDEKGETSRVGNYEVHFCCAGCKPAFDRLDEKSKRAKIAAALQKH